MCLLQENLHSKKQSIHQKKICLLLSEVGQNIRTGVNYDYLKPRLYQILGEYNSASVSWKAGVSALISANFDVSAGLYSKVAKMALKLVW